jgi:hypothetical protein
MQGIYMAINNGMPKKEVPGRTFTAGLLKFADSPK